VLLATTFAAPVRADVVAAAAGGFHVRSQVEVPGDPATAWALLVTPAEWWDPLHSWFGAADGFSLEPVPGGCFCERGDGGAVRHLTVAHVEPGRLLRLTGGLGPLQGLGLHGTLEFRLEPVPDAPAPRTRIVQEYRVHGWLPEGLEALAGAVDGVQRGQLERLAARLRRAEGEGRE
jgi:hypothetical protein